MTAGRGVPLLVDVGGRRIVCVGAGRVAAAKLAPLLEAGADVEVVAPDAVAGIAEAAAAGRLRWRQRPYRPGDVTDAFLVLAATADPATNAAVVADADAAATLSVRVDADGDGSASLLAAVRRGPLALAVSTGGAAPALARRIRADLEARYGPEHGALAELLGGLRNDAEVRAALAGLDDAERRQRWHAVLDVDLLPLLRGGRRAEAERRARTVLVTGGDGGTVGLGG